MLLNEISYQPANLTTWTLTKRLEKKLDGNYTRMRRAIFNKSWRQHPTRHQLYGHLPPITKTIQVRGTRHAGHCWRSRGELISDVLLWTPTHCRAKAGRPERTYIQQLCEYTGCSPDDLPEARNDSGERVSGISVLPARHDDEWWFIERVKTGLNACVCVCVCERERKREREGERQTQTVKGMLYWLILFFNYVESISKTLCLCFLVEIVSTVHSGPLPFEGTLGGFCPNLVVLLTGWSDSVTARGYLCIYNFITPMCSGLDYLDLLPLVKPLKPSSCIHCWNIFSEKSLIDSSVKSQYATYPIFFKCSPVDIFPGSLFITLPIHIFRKAEGQQKQNKTIITHLRMWRFHYFTLARSSYYLNNFWIVSWHALLFHMHTLKLQYNYISHFKKHHMTLLCNSLRKLKTSQYQRLGSKILVSKPVTLVIPATRFILVPYDHTPVIHSTGSYLE